MPPTTERGVDLTLFVDPQTGHHFDDTRRYVDALHLSASAQDKVYELNARRVYPRLRRGPGGWS